MKISTSKYEAMVLFLKRPGRSFQMSGDTLPLEKEFKYHIEERWKKRVSEAVVIQSLSCSVVLKLLVGSEIVRLGVQVVKMRFSWTSRVPRQPWNRPAVHPN